MSGSCPLLLVVPALQSGLAPHRSLLLTALLFLLSSSIEDRGVNMARSVNVGQQIVFVASFQRNFLSSS